MSDLVRRPLWRGFAERSLAAAARHARAGGIAVVRARRWYLLGDAGPAGEPVPLFVDWAIRAVEADGSWAEQTDGPATGLVKAPVSAGWRSRVEEWIERDAAHAGATVEERYDCMKCAACCHANKVVLDAEDVARFRAGGREDLMKTTVVTKGVRTLPLVKNDTKPCVHLKDLLCSIYPVRPNMCRDFPAGTEHCITSREELFGTAFPEHC
jgi:Fe-S-cluster containining protein